MNQQTQQIAVQWPFYRLVASTHRDVDGMEDGADEPHDAEQADAEIDLDAEPSSSTVRKVVINGRVVMQNNVLQSTMDAMVRQAAQDAPAALN